MGKIIKDTLIYIPCRNSGHSAEHVLARLKKAVAFGSTSSVLIVDNASRDYTLNAIKLFMEKNKRFAARINIIKNKRDMGYGGSQKIAYRYAARKGFRYVVMLHSDGQYPPEYIGSLFKKTTKCRCDMVFGSRFRGNPTEGNMSLARYFGNRVLSTLENFFLGTNFSELHSGLRIFKVSSLLKANFEKCCDNYCFDSQVLFLMLKNRMKVEDIPIPTTYNSSSQSPSKKELLLYSISSLQESIKCMLSIGIYRTAGHKT